MSKEKTLIANNGVIIIRMWPKTPIFYPMAFFALICGLVSEFYGIPAELASVKKVVPVEQPSPSAPPASPTTAIPASPKSQSITSPMAAQTDLVREDRVGLIHTAMGMMFFLVFAFSMFVVCIDFEVRWALISFSIVLLVIMGLYMAERLGHINLPTPKAILSHFQLYATPLFYYSIFGVWVILMFISWMIARLHYVKIEQSEVIAFGGLMENQRRVSTIRMSWTRNVTDVFEYWLPFVRSGTLVLKFPNDEPLVLENVLNIDKVMRRLDKSNLSGRAVDKTVDKQDRD